MEPPSGYGSVHPFLTEAAACLLRDRGAQLVGIDSLNIDSIEDGSRPVQTVLLGANIPICERLCARDLLPDRASRFRRCRLK
ncbi:MAG TPA: hypothetical protein VKV17_11125 [Bryobacteraceae bacterium]|nr:hypothetical protein [Bryobacteraceae bacterium]